MEAANLVDDATRKGKGAEASRIASLRSRLLNGASATATLEQWCCETGLSMQPRLRALRVNLQCPAPDQVRQALRVAEGESVSYRRVQLICADRILSEADNWYLPALLTRPMNERLKNSDEPFGRVVDALGFQRETLGDQSYWPPLGDAGVVLEVHALLRDQRHRPFSYVVESYLRQLIS